MGLCRRSNLSTNDIRPNLRHVSAVHLLAQEDLHCPFARSSHARSISVRETMQFVDGFNAGDSLSVLFRMRYIKSSNPSKGKNQGSNPGIAPIRLSGFALVNPEL